MNRHVLGALISGADDETSRLIIDESPSNGKTGHRYDFVGHPRGTEVFSMIAAHNVNMFSRFVWSSRAASLYGRAATGLA